MGDDELMDGVGVCSWSLRVGSVADLVGRVRETGLGAVQLALDPVRIGEMGLEDVGRGLDRADITVLSGMIGMEGEDYTTLESIRRTGGVVPDATWPVNLARTTESARIAGALGIRLVTFHAGFVPHDNRDPRHAVLLDRLRRMADTFAEAGVRLALETGQETAPTMLGLVRALEAHDIGVNFDPANMILYGMGDPIAALGTLAPYVRQVHIKDAIAASEAGQWGMEVPVGEGDVDWGAFFNTLEAHRIRPNLVIEREAGERRVEDVLSAIDFVKGVLRTVIRSTGNAQ
jgi:sugar phosphate isomerase/epimerase